MNAGWFRPERGTEENKERYDAASLSQSVISDHGEEPILPLQGGLKGQQKIELNQRLQPPNAIMKGQAGLFISPTQLSWEMKLLRN
jgi:hypothetical protein